MTPIEALLLGILIGAGLLVAGRGMHVGELARRDREWLAEVFDNLRVGLHHPEDEPEVEQVVEADVVDEPSSLPLDPDDPPLPRVYRHRPGRPVQACHCHGRQLEDGETVLFWPNPDVKGAFWLVCVPEEATV